MTSRCLFFFTGITSALGVCNVTAVVKTKPDKHPEVFIVVSHCQDSVACAAEEFESVVFYVAAQMLRHVLPKGFPLKNFKFFIRFPQKDGFKGVTMEIGLAAFLKQEAI